MKDGEKEKKSPSFSASTNYDARIKKKQAVEPAAHHHKRESHKCSHRKNEQTTMQTNLEKLLSLSVKYYNLVEFFNKFMSGYRDKLLDRRICVNGK